MDERCDVAILGGGLAGLTLGLQLKRSDPELSVMIAEKRVGPAALAAFKVGESTVDVSCHYFGEVLGLWDHLAERHVYKAGLRFFFPSDGNRDLARRVEFGPPTVPLPVPTYQIDRGLFENELADRCRAAGAQVLDGARVLDVDLGNEHVVHIARGGAEHRIAARWVIDATGRAFLLKRKLGLVKDVPHKVDAAWLRLANGLDLEAWADNPQWMAHMSRPGIRRSSTNHLMGAGYWAWLIPLGTGPISIGIVTDPRLHPFERIATLDAAIEWLHEHEPPLGAAIDARRSDVEDFLTVEDFAYGAERVFSPARWALTGEAGVFADPLYSPGSDFIAYGNCYIADLILRDRAGEDIAGRAEAFNAVFLTAFDAVLEAYVDHYPAMGNPQVMAAKVAWDHAWYWGVNAFRFMSGRLCDLEGMATIGPPLLRSVELTRLMQVFFRAWAQLDDAPAGDAFLDLTAFPQPLQRGLVGIADLDRETFVARLTENVQTLEAMAVLLFDMAARRIGSAIDGGTLVDPYSMRLGRQLTPAANGSGLTPAAARARIGDLANLSIHALHGVTDLAGD